MLELKKLSGTLNLDDPYEMVAPDQHVNARNIRFVNGQVQTVKGNSLVDYSMPSGTNITIGDCYDYLNQRIFFFNYNSNFIHGIYLYSIATNSVQTLIINGAETDGDVLEFEPDSYFPDVRIIYGDETQGDILYWLNSQKLPSKINIQRALGELGSYGIIEKTFLTVDKEIPNMPPAVVFEDDDTVTVNNFRKKLMKYKTRYVFDDKDKSAYSSHSVIPLPIGYTDTNADFNADPSKNARVAIVIPTGKRNVKKIEICACESLGNVFGDWFLIHVIDKEADGVDSETLTTYRFYNDQAYTYVDLAESEQEFDWVPQEANAQETLNGNVLAYGGILEGYNQITSDAAAESLTEEQIKTTQYPFVFVGNQSGDSGFGTGEILAKVIGQMPVGWIFHIETTSYDITYTVQEGDTATEVLAGLLAAAIVDGFTGTSGTEDLLITKADEVLQLVRVEQARPSNTETGVSIQWESVTHEFFTFSNYADRWYLFPVGTDFTISGATDPSFNGTFHITGVALSDDGLDLLIETNTVIATPFSVFTGDILSYPDRVTLLSLSGLSAIFYSTTSRIKIIGGSIYVTDFTVGQNFTISGAGISTFNRTYEIDIINLSGDDLYLTVSAFTGTDETSETVDLSSYILDTNNNPYVETDSPSYDWSSSYAFGLEYFDYWGRTMGTITQRALSVQTIPYSDNGSTSAANLPKIGLSIEHRPPLEARYYQWVRTKNLTKSAFVQWISNATYKDTEYAYISIEILNQYIIENPQSSFLAWDFTPGDRIRFMKSLSALSSMSTYTDKDYEIIASLTDPYINGLLVEGQVLKISLPSTDDYFDFGGTWPNYFIELYTPAKNVGNGLDLYYEFGERYDIGDAGLSTRFHQGQLQNQTPDLSQPATFEFIQGDNYFTQRTLNIGNSITYTIESATWENDGSGDYFLGMTKISGFDVQEYVVADQTYGVFTVSTPIAEYFIKVLNGEYTFRVEGQITVRVDTYNAPSGETGTLRFIYTPYTGVDPTSLAEESGPFTEGQVLVLDIDTTLTRDATDYGTMTILLSPYQTDGDPVDMVFTIVSGYLNVVQTGQEFTLGMQNPNYSFFYESAVNANGRPWVVNPDGRQSYNMALMRYGLAYQQDTNINQVNRFYASQLDQYDRSKGDIRRFKFRQRQLRVFQSGGVGQIGVYAQFITNAAGATQLIYTSQIITPNNIQYYIGEHGMGIQNTSLVSAKNVDYFIDPVTGDWMRVSNDGMTSVSDLYKGQYTISNLLVKYNFPWYRADGSQAKIIGAYDYFDEQCVYVLQSGSRVDYADALTFYGETLDGRNYTTYLEGTPIPGDIVYLTLRSGTDTPLTYSYVAQVGDGSPQIILGLIASINEGSEFSASVAGDWGLLATTTATDENIAGRTSINYINAISIPAYALSFNEKRNAFCSFYDFNGADSIMSAENMLYTFLNGFIYKHDSATYCNFFGVQYPASITLDFDGGSAAKKSFISLSYQANGVWTAPEIQTQLDTYGTTPQSSKLVAGNIAKLEGVYHASFLRDMNSPGGWLNGYSLKGGYLVIKLVSPSDGGFYFINIISVKSTPSELNNT